MPNACYVLFECYSEGVLMFRSYAKLAGDVTPVPLSDAQFQRCQSIAIKQRKKLSYEFISGRLTKAAAIDDLKRRNGAESESGSLSWLPSSGKRLSAGSLHRVH